MKTSQKKLLNIGFFFTVMIVGIIITYTMDTLKQTRLELEAFFRAELRDCKITSVVTRQYSGRGDYQLFKTNCGNEYYPILLETGTDSEFYNCFEEGMIVNKATNSVELTLLGTDRQISLNIRHPLQEDDRFETMQIILIFFGVPIFIMMFIPNTFWNKKKY